MAVSINQPAVRKKKDILDNIAQGVQIAAGLVGTGLAIPEFLQKREVTEEGIKLSEARRGQIGAQQKALEVENAPLTPEEVQGFRDQGVPDVAIPKVRSQIPGIAGKLIVNPQQRVAEKRLDLMISQGEERNKGLELDRQIKANKAQREADVLDPASEVSTGFVNAVTSANPGVGAQLQGQSLQTAKGIYPELVKQYEKADKIVADQESRLPDINSRVENIDSALDLAESVVTGPFVGSKAAIAIRQLWDSNSQLLESVVNKEALNTVKEVAKEAGARSIDTDREREFLERTTPRLNQHPEVLRTILLVNKSALEKAKLETRAKREHLRSNVSLSNYQSPLEGKASFYNPKNNEVTFSEPGNPPEGFKSIGVQMDAATRAERNPEIADFADENQIPLDIAYQILLKRGEIE